MELKTRGGGRTKSVHLQWHDYGENSNVIKEKNLQASKLFDKVKRCKMTTQESVQFLYIHKEMVTMNYMNNPMHNTSQN